MITTTDPRTGVSANSNIPETTDDEVAAVASAAAGAEKWLAELGRADRAELLERIADGLDEERMTLVATACAETGLSESRLNGELSRSAFQFRMFAEAVRDGGYLEAAIDHAGETPLGPAPDVRRLLIPIGTVAVFGSSNFPFAFSVAGGDAASALAVGAPVVFKAHGSHPLTSARSFRVIAAALAQAGGPEGAVGIVFGQGAGAALVACPQIKAVGFTGSMSGAEALRAVIARRDEPIPFYGELSSINPVVVTPLAAERRAADIAEGLTASITGSGGQLCTKPGVLLVPRGPAGEVLVAELSRRIEGSSPQVLLNRRIRQSFDAIADGLHDAGATERARASQPVDDAGFAVQPTLLEADADDFGRDLAEECFGPLALVVRYGDTDQAHRVLEALPGSLTATIHAEAEEKTLAADLGRVCSGRAGRLVFNGYPTGVRVSWAQHHGGPWPSTNTLHTSVGVAAVRRFLRPFVWQDAPPHVLPTELRDGQRTVPARIDGTLVMPGQLGTAQDS